MKHHTLRLRASLDVPIVGESFDDESVVAYVLDEPERSRADSCREDTDREAPERYRLKTRAGHSRRVVSQPSDARAIMRARVLTEMNG